MIKKHICLLKNRLQSKPTEHIKCFWHSFGFCIQVNNIQADVSHQILHKIRLKIWKFIEDASHFLYAYFKFKYLIKYATELSIDIVEYIHIYPL